MECTECFSDYLVQCVDSIRVFAQLEPLTAYTWVVIDKFDKQYSHEFTTDADGFWEIDIDDLPEGLLTQFSGVFILQVQDAGCKPIKFKIAQEYDCVMFELRGGSRLKNTIGCDFSCTPASGVQSRMFSFEDTDDFVITWTDALRLTYGNAPVIQVFHEVSTGVFTSVTVSIDKTYDIDDNLISITIHNGGVQTGHVIVS